MSRDAERPATSGVNRPPPPPLKSTRPRPGVLARSEPIGIQDGGSPVGATLLQEAARRGSLRTPVLLNINGCHR
ncbi:hypothetical protein EYF80_051793 [Liparis tanakae]|uniref:Uncharacterized protein n=1 Tax=Liparis tanakae TaxID=230148 RepID=A0A4Z2FAX8_9TELE|nr:hypothetical protein EYF80_051793 [Liparis tanakae]